MEQVVAEEARDDQKMKILRFFSHRSVAYMQTANERGISLRVIQGSTVLHHADNAYAL